MEKIKELTINTLEEVNDEENKKQKRILIWSIIFFIYPFIAGLIYGLFFKYTFTINPPILGAKISFLFDLLSNYLIYAISFLLSSILSLIDIIKHKQRSLINIFILIMSLLFLYTSLSLYVS